MLYGARTAGAFVTAVLACAVLLTRARGETPGPVFLSAEIKRAASLYSKGAFAQACPIFARAAAAQPSNPLIRVGCAVHERAPLRIQRELKSLSRVIGRSAKEHAITGAWLAEAGYCRMAEDEFRLAAPAAEPGAYHFATGQSYQDIVDIESATRAFRTAVEKNPGKEDNSLHLAILLISAGDSQAGGTVLADALKRNPTSVPPITATSLLHLELGYPDRARMGYERARAIAPNSPAVWKLFGRIQVAEGAYAAAVASFDRAAEIAPRDAQPYFFKGVALSRMQDKRDEALAAFARAVEPDPALIEAHFESANIYFNADQDYARAAGELERVLAVAPRHTRARQLLIQCYSRAGLRDKAAAQAAELRPLTTARAPDERHD